MSNETNEKKWYYAEDQERKGPVSQEQLIEFIQTGAITDAALLWTQGFENWRKVGDTEMEVYLKKTQPGEVPPPVPDDVPPPIKKTHSMHSMNEKVYTAVNAVSEKAKGKNKKIWGILAAALVVILFFAFSGSEGSRAINAVRNGNLTGYPDKTVGQALEHFMANVKWEAIKAADGKTYVNIKGKITYGGVPADALVQYQVDSKKNIFTFNAFEINGQAMNFIIYLGLITAAFE